MRRFTTALLAALVGSAIVPAAAFAANGGEINSGDTAWMLAATALVMIMLDSASVDTRPFSEIADRAVTEEVVRLLRQHRAAGSKRVAGLLAEPGAIADSFWVVVPHELSTEAGEVRIPASTARSVAPALATPLQPIRSRDAIATRG